MPRPRSDRLSAPRVLGHVVVMLAVAAVMGLVAAGLAIPFAGVLGIGAKQVAYGDDSCRPSSRPSRWPSARVMVDAAGNLIATLYDENRINVPLARSRGRWSRRSSPSRTTASTSTARST